MSPAQVAVKYMGYAAVKHTLIVSAQVAAAVAVLLGAFWAVGRPHAADYIRNVVQIGGYARAAEVNSLAGEVRTLNRNVDQLQDSIAETRKNQRRLEQGQAETAAKLETIEDLSKEQRQLLNQLLLQLRERN